MTEKAGSYDRDVTVKHFTQEDAVRALQKEMQRSGHYDGPVTGTWTPETNEDFTKWLREQQAVHMGVDNADGWAGPKTLKGLDGNISTEAHGAIKSLLETDVDGQSAYSRLHSKNGYHDGKITFEAGNCAIEKPDAQIIPTLPSEITNPDAPEAVEPVVPPTKGPDDGLRGGDASEAVEPVVPPTKGPDDGLRGGDAPEAVEPVVPPTKGPDDGLRGGDAPKAAEPSVLEGEILDEIGPAEAAPEAMDPAEPSTKGPDDGLRGGDFKPAEMPEVEGHEANPVPMPEGPAAPEGENSLPASKIPNVGPDALQRMREGSEQPAHFAEVADPASQMPGADPSAWAINIDPEGPYAQLAKLIETVEEALGIGRGGPTNSPPPSMMA